MAASKTRFPRVSQDVTGGEAWGYPRDTTVGGTPIGEEAKAGVGSQLEIELRIDQLEFETVRLEERLARLARGGTVVAIDTLAPEAPVLLKPFHVNVDPWDEGFRACFLDANLMAFGETDSEALWNLKDLIATTFETLTGAGEQRLGPGPARQLAVLSRFIRR